METNKLIKKALDDLVERRSKLEIELNNVGHAIDALEAYVNYWPSPEMPTIDIVEAPEQEVPSAFRKLTTVKKKTKRYRKTRTRHVVEGQFGKIREHLRALFDTPQVALKAKNIYASVGNIAGVNPASYKSRISFEASVFSAMGKENIRRDSTTGLYSRS